MAELNRSELLYEYDRLLREMTKVGLDPVVTDAVLDIFTDSELRALIKDSALRLIRFRRLEGEL
jgi:hypothetical protein